MSTKLLISLISLLAFLLVSCDGNSEQHQIIGAASYGTYRFDECIVKVELDRQKTLSYEEYYELNRLIVPDLLLKAVKSNSYPLYQTDTTKSGSAREYYFFFATLCEDKLKYVDSIVKTYFLSKRKYADVPYEISAITSKELPEGVGGFRGLWTDR